MKMRKDSAILIGAVLMIYIFSYFMISRRSFVVADHQHMEGFYFVWPANTATRRINRTLVYLYYPLIILDIAIGTGRQPASDPLIEVSESAQAVTGLCKIRRIGR